MIKIKLSSRMLIASIILVLSVIDGVSDVSAGIKKIAILDFDDSTAISQYKMRNPVYMYMAMQGQPIPQEEKGRVGKLVTDTLTTAIVKDGIFKIIERNKLQKIIEEQALTLSGAIDTSDAAKIGKVLGVSAVITGSVTQFNVEENTFGLLGLGVKTHTGKVEVNVRVIDTSTAEVMLAMKGQGEESKSGIQIGQLFSSNFSEFESSLLGLATQKALASIISEIKGQSAKLKDSSIQSTIVYFDPAKKTYLIDAGRDSGLEMGHKLSVIKIVREIKSPSTGQVLKRITEKIADITISEIDKTSSTALCVAGKCEEIKEGDTVFMTDSNLPSMGSTAFLRGNAPDAASVKQTDREVGKAEGELKKETENRITDSEGKKQFQEIENK